MKLYSESKLTKYFKYIIVALVFVVYGNAINNEYAIDDSVVVSGNPKVEKGFAGIKEIFTSHYEQANKQSYEYRPIVQLTFAIEKQFFKRFKPAQTVEEKQKKDEITQANISHFINLLLYALLCILVYLFLKELFPDVNIYLIILATLIFTIHPIHTEPVNNLKSRDELLVMIFCIQALRLLLKYFDKKKILYLAGALLFIVISFLTKKTTIFMLGVVPLTLYFKSGKLFKSVWPALLVVVGFFALRKIKSGLLEEKSIRIINFFENPLFTQDYTFVQKIPIALYSTWHYLTMLIFPYNLSFYYGYNQIPMADWSYWQVWVALIIVGGLLYLGIKMFKTNKILSYGIFFMLGNMLIYSNLFFPLVGIVADRFAFVMSLGYSIVIAAGIFIFSKINLATSNFITVNKTVLTSIFAFLMIYSVRTIARNNDWENTFVLFENDIDHLENSAKANSLFANHLFPELPKHFGKPEYNELVNKTIYHYKKSIEIDTTYKTSMSNLGAALINYKKDYKEGLKYCLRAIAIDSNYYEAYFNAAFAYQNLNKPKKAIKYYIKVISLKPDHDRVYNYLNNLVLSNKIQNLIIPQLEQIVTKSPHKNIYMELANMYSLNNDYTSALKNFVSAFEMDTTDKKLCAHILKLARQTSNQEIYSKFKSMCN
ncbi:MAG: hypothetical protein Kow0079_04450 [Vicingaceae bacterium]